MPARLRTSIRMAPRYEDGVYGSGELMGEVCAARMVSVKAEADRAGSRSRLAAERVGRPESKTSAAFLRHVHELIAQVVQSTGRRRPLGRGEEVHADRCTDRNGSLVGLDRLTDPREDAFRGPRGRVRVGEVGEQELNSSPPRRTAESVNRVCSRMRAPTARMTSSPATWPCLLLIALNPSRSIASSAAY